MYVMDLQDVNEIMHILWVRKAVRNTRALVLTAGSQPTFGIQSLIRDPEILRQRYGVRSDQASIYIHFQIYG